MKDLVSFKPTPNVTKTKTSAKVSTGCCAFYKLLSLAHAVTSCMGFQA